MRHRLLLLILAALVMGGCALKQPRAVVPAATNGDYPQWVVVRHRNGAFVGAEVAISTHTGETVSGRFPTSPMIWEKVGCCEGRHWVLEAQAVWLKSPGDVKNGFFLTLVIPGPRVSVSYDIPWGPSDPVFVELAVSTEYPRDVPIVRLDFGGETYWPRGLSPPR